MSNDLDALLTALYVHVEDRVFPVLGWSRDHRPGRKPGLSDGELITLAVAQQLLGVASERRWVRFARARLGGLFPYLPGQSGYGKRLRSLGGLLAAVITELARDTPSWHDDLRLLDSTPLPCAASRETVKRSDLAGHAGYGYCASHSRFFWGFRLYLVTTAEGMPIIWGLANPKIGERDAARALLDHDHHLVASGQVILADKGFAGRDFDQFVTSLGAHLIRPDRKDEPTRRGKLARVRQWIEAVFDTLKGQLTLEEHGARTLNGVHARIAARLLALATAIWHNWHTGTQAKRSLIAYDH
ncbi:IS982 family transposase [Jiangella alba]|uniref:Transposase DDE domain-containing protein n=1 Tax=Jiangella alba TaxID=561176 RepID=A0A1H5PTX3_9ACTN|nr:IS982 family transposase [Jiangella alba]SEE30068.1 Transposase DDE domain-containing protein [Jiangella alba]SEE63024.1 Transposase DDE domain-containing protein [Jiangella alba]SEF09163.1 Transposase DDE domain-containing protein [Jiangella alba]SEF17322.1 Transposase DDE domain-containing protein [Jiangella alba]